MAITQDEMQDIVSAVISAIRTNSRTIDQLTPVTSLSDNDSIEINGGKRVSVGVIKSLIEALATSEHDSLKILITKQELSSLDISATDEEVTMTVSSKSKTVSASFPIATITSAGVVKAADMVRLQSAYNKANEAETQSAALQTALEALKARVSQGEGRIDTNESDIATLQDDLQSVAQALNALSGSGDTTAVIDTFKEVVDFLAGITNDETLSAKLMELKGLLKDHGDDIEGLKEQVTQITQTVDEDRELQNAQGTAISQMQKDLSEAQNELGELSQLLVDYEDDAALALSNAEARLGSRIDAVGILPFNSIVEAHGSVSDGAPDYATQFPATADGAYRHIIFDKSRGTFLWEIHAGDYPNCPAGDAYSAWTGSEEYVSEGHPRADRLYRMGNELYRWDGTALVSYSDAISAAKYATFDAQWTAAGGTVITPGKTYECNGTDDLSFDEAVEIFGWYTKAFVADSSYRFEFYPHRALLPVASTNEKNITADRMFTYAKTLEVIKFRGPAGGNLAYVLLTKPIAAFMRCEALREIDTPIQFYASPDSAFSSCAALEEVRLYKLAYNVSFGQSPHLSLASLQYLVDNAANTKAITVTVHPDVFAKLTGDITNAAAAALTAEELAQWQQVLADAVTKNISFATT